MERGAINGVPVWVRLSELTNQERTVVKEAPDIDGALVEPQGQMPSQYRIEFMLIRDGEWITSDYETASLELRAMFLEGGPFTVSLPVLGELTDLWMAEAVTLKFFDETRLAISEGSVTMLEGRPQLILSEDAGAETRNSISRLSRASVLSFGARAPDEPGWSEGALAVLDAFGQWLSDTQGLISAAFEPVNNFSASIQILRSQLESLLLTPQNFAARVMSTAGGLLSLVPSLSQQGDPLTGSAAVQDSGNDKPAVTFIEALATGTTFDSDVPPTQGEVLGEGASEEDLTELGEVDEARSLALAAVTSSVCLAITSTQFATINSILNVAEALEAPFEELFAIDGIEYSVYSEARALRAATRQYLSEQAAGLPRLRTYTTIRPESLLSVLPELYESLESEDQVQAAVDSLSNLNAVARPWDIPTGTTLRYLEPLVA